MRPRSNVRLTSELTHQGSNTKTHENPKATRLPAVRRALLGLTLLVNFFVNAFRRLPPVPRLLVYTAGSIDDVLDELLGLLCVLLPLSLPLSLVPIVGAPGLPALGPTRAALVLHGRGHEVRNDLSRRARVDPAGEGEESAEDDAPFDEPEREHDRAVEAGKGEVRAEDGEEGGDDGVWSG